MSEKASQFRIGLFVVLGVAIVLAGLFVFGIRSAFQPTYMFETYTTGDVDGLTVGSVVKLRGVRGRQGHRDRVQLEHVRTGPARLRRRARPGGAEDRARTGAGRLRRGSPEVRRARSARRRPDRGDHRIEHRLAADHGREAVSAAAGALEAEVRVHPVGAEPARAPARLGRPDAREPREVRRRRPVEEPEPRPRHGRRRAEEPEPARREGDLAEREPDDRRRRAPRSRRSRGSPRTPARTCGA